MSENKTWKAPFQVAALILQAYTLVMWVSGRSRICVPKNMTLKMVTWMTVSQLILGMALVAGSGANPAQPMKLIAQRLYFQPTQGCHPQQYGKKQSKWVNGKLGDWRWW